MHRKVLSVLVVLFTVFTFNLSAEEEWYWGQPVTKIDFSGLKNVKKSELTGITSSFIDQPFSEELYNELLDRLYELDFFEDIEPYAKHDSKGDNNVLLVFEVVERPVVKTINFIGNTKIRNGELREQVRMKTSDIYVESKLLLDERLLRNHYLEKGFSSSKITHTTEETEEGIIINFMIDEGSGSVIKEIRFAGNTIVSGRTLKSKLKSKELGLFKDGAYQPVTIERDKQIIVSYYKEKGYADAAVLDVKIETEENTEKQRSEMTITFVIQEGQQYTYSGIRISGNEIFEDSELLKQPKLKSGAIYNEVKFQEDLSAIQNVYYENGYMNNEFYPVPNKDNDRHEISYDLTIRERSRSHIENIIIKGNSKTKDYVIRREIPINEGDIFSRDKIINGLRNLMNLQYFSNVVPEPQPGSEENLVDIVWSLEEQSTSSFQFGLTFSGVTDPGAIPISLYLKLENSNVFGEGKVLAVGTTVSNTEQSVDLSYSQGWIGNLPIGFSQSLSVAHRTLTGTVNYWTPTLDLTQSGYTMTYDGWAASLVTGVSRRWYPDYAILSVSAGLGNSISNNIYDESLFAPVDLGIATYANRWGLSNYFYTSFSVDNRDISYDPTKGWFGSQRLTWYGLLPKVEKEYYLRSDTKLEGYLKLFDLQFTEKYALKLILAGYTGLSVLYPAENGISESNKLYIDGMFNGRGWSDTTNMSRGELMLSNKLELRVPVIPGILGINGFLDAVAIKNSHNDLSSITMNDFYFSYGPGIRFLIPQFPLHLLFAWKFRVIDNAPKFDDNPFQFVLSFNVVNR